MVIDVVDYLVHLGLEVRAKERFDVRTPRDHGGWLVALGPFCVGAIVDALYVDALYDVGIGG